MRKHIREKGKLFFSAFIDDDLDGFEDGIKDPPSLASLSLGESTCNHWSSRRAGKSKPSMPKIQAIIFSIIFYARRTLIDQCQERGRLVPTIVALVWMRL